VLGYTLTMGVGGGDVPLVITLLNSYSGWALCAEGFMLNIPMLTTVGALVGSSGAILSIIMCDAMNRSVVNVIFGGLPGDAQKAAGGPAAASAPQVHVEATVEGVARDLVEAKKVIIVPGYGLAVARAQYAVADMVTRLRAAGATWGPPLLRRSLGRNAHGSGVVQWGRRTDAIDFLAQVGLEGVVRNQQVGPHGQEEVAKVFVGGKARAGEDTQRLHRQRQGIALVSAIGQQGPGARCVRVGGGMTLRVNGHPFGQRSIEPLKEGKLARHEGGGTEVDDQRVTAGGETEGHRVGAEHFLSAAKRRHVTR
jgi:hypothetical protein